MALQQALILTAILILCSAASMAAIVPLDKPAMAVKVQAGEYKVLGRVLTVARTVELPIAPPDRVVVKSEEHILTSDQPRSWFGGTALKQTLGPVDIYTRLPKAIAPETVRVHSEPEGGILYEEGKDYILDHDWGGMCRTEEGRIGKTQKVYINYEVCLQRVDAIQLAGDGTVSVKKGEPGPVNVNIPATDLHTARLANIYIPYRTAAITADSIYPVPPQGKSWRDFIKVSGRERLSNTLSMLREGKPVTVVCWGDSVTEGGSPSSHDRCYVELFRSRLQAAYPQAKINLINAGIGGSNTDSRRDGYEKEVLAHNPDLITVEYVNDAGMSADRIKHNYAEFIARAREKNPKVEFIILTPHSVMPEWMGNFPVSMPAMRRAAEENQVALGDTNNIWEHLRDIAIPYQILEANGINHPNDLGHEFFAETLMALMSPE